MRLIDADAIKLEKGFFENIDNVPKFFEWLGKQPTIDPVKHGRWIDQDDPYGFFDAIPVCSECGHTTKMREKYKYCPNCGARMDVPDNDVGETEGEEG